MRKTNLMTRAQATKIIKEMANGEAFSLQKSILTYSEHAGLCSDNKRRKLCECIVVSHNVKGAASGNCWEECILELKNKLKGDNNENNN